MDWHHEEPDASKFCKNTGRYFVSDSVCTSVLFIWSTHFFISFKCSLFSVSLLPLIHLGLIFLGSALVITNKISQQAKTFHPSGRLSPSNFHRRGTPEETNPPKRKLVTSMPRLISIMLILEQIFCQSVLPTVTSPRSAL